MQSYIPKNAVTATIKLYCSAGVATQNPVELTKVLLKHVEKFLNHIKLLNNEKVNVLTFITTDVGAWEVANEKGICQPVTTMKLSLHF